ncbi:ribonuclease G [Leuconostoc lactis]|uniref:ribonuclease G n=2 Tax=Leuconostoc lactis TaxID=1246 RepID=UPI0031DE1A6C
MNENGKTVPEEIRGWNWGAFIYNIFWGIGNKTYLPLLCLIPVFNLVWVFVCGFKGNEWAWQKSDYQDVDTFKAAQKSINWTIFIQLLRQHLRYDCDYKN